MEGENFNPLSPNSAAANFLQELLWWLVLYRSMAGVSVTVMKWPQIQVVGYINIQMNINEMDDKGVFLESFRNQLFLW